MKSTTGSQHTFATVPHSSMPRSSFNRSSGWKGTADSGYLIPFFCDEVYPGDTFNHKSTIFGRMATPLYPVMDNLKLTSFFFFVPNRLVWDNFKRMMGEQDNPSDSTDYLTPHIVAPSGGYGENSLQDYLGLPTKVEGYEHNALPLRGINRIYNEWFRDENLQDSLPVEKGDGPDNPSNYSLFRRGKRHDYFTSALPFPQKGEQVSIPLGQTAPIATTATEGFNPSLLDANGVLSTMRATGGGDTVVVGDAGGNPMYADLSSATAATINQLREAFAIQHLFEKDARGGTRYTELVRSHFGVTSPDARLQRSEFLGGGSSYVNINPVAQTADTDTPTGTLGAMGTVTATDHGFTKSFTEHGFIIGFFQISADLNYQNSLNRFWSRSDKLSYYWPSFANLGEQEILNKEIYCQGTAGGNADDEVFGYQERYAELRYSPSIITGQFRSNAAQTLDAWHLAQNFENLPTLSATFIEDNPPVDRVIATPEEPQFIFDCFHNTIAARPLPTYGVPGLSKM